MSFTSSTSKIRRGQKRANTLFAKELRENISIKNSKVEQITFLLDKVCVGDSFYHEIPMIMGSPPRSYLVKQSPEQLNKTCHIEALDGNSEGVKVS